MIDKKKKQKKQKKELSPQITEETGVISDETLKLLAENIDKSIVVPESNKNSETFFKEVVNAMNKEENISMKTEYLGVRENFTGTKLEFLALMGNMPYLKRFVKIFETKRVSLGRKGRKEDVMILQERNAEIQREKQTDFANLFNVGKT